MRINKNLLPQQFVKMLQKSDHDITLKRIYDIVKGDKM